MGIGASEKSGMILNNPCGRIGSARCLDKFLTIISNAPLSISEAKDDLEQTVEATEASLSDLRDAISKVSLMLLQDVGQDIEPELVAEVSTIIAAGKTNAAKFMANQATFTEAAEREEQDRKGEQEERGRRMMAWCKLFC